MRAVIAVVAAVAIAIVVWLILRDRDDAARAPIPASAPAPANMPAPPAGTSRAPAHVTKVSPDERKRLADRIAAAQAARGAHAAPPRPSLPAPERLDSNDLDHVSTTLLAAMKEAIPILAECYDRDPKGKRTAAANMTLTGDPDVGTVIDADQISDEEGKPLDPKVDDCLRSTLQSLALPPLTEGDKIRVKYSFRFD